MPRPRKLKKIKLFNNKKAVGEFFDIIFDVGKKVYDNVTKKEKPQPTPEPEPSPKPQKAEAPPLSTFIQKENAIHERLLNQKKVAKQFLKRLG